MCGMDSAILPPGWEMASIEGTIVYLDHINREAHEEPPSVVWHHRLSKAATRGPAQGASSPAGGAEPGEVKSEVKLEPSES